MIFFKVIDKWRTKVVSCHNKVLAIRFFKSDQNSFFGQVFLMKILLQFEASQFDLARLCEYGIESPHLVVPESW